MSDSGIFHSRPDNKGNSGVKSNIHRQLLNHHNQGERQRERESRRSRKSYSVCLCKCVWGSSLLHNNYPLSLPLSDVWMFPSLPAAAASLFKHPHPSPLYLYIITKCKSSRANFYRHGGKRNKCLKVFELQTMKLYHPWNQRMKGKERRQSGIVRSFNCRNLYPSNASRETRGDSTAADSSVMDMQQTLFQLSFLSSYLHLYSIPAVSYSIIFQLSLSQSQHRSQRWYSAAGWEQFMCVCVCVCVCLHAWSVS